ncbi:uncharacterized protein CCOS01_14878 [Colletotrichum costaricense]|uniref:Uncharacterized protein n=1 Tax=Colletotrichum costaricense TaxID=1209916 RepID=A0AAI9YIM5_9PEZI|nr:uncharacterized protein CCOS01_14878 [Colletotrichum costaricense]KAK1511116.1 hypothetical protein CCOS01_14878 [Colletotrichum costaricense]
MPWFVSEKSTLASLPNFERLDIIVEGSHSSQGRQASLPRFQGWPVYKSIKSLRFLCAFSAEGQAVSADLTPAWGGSQLIAKLPNITSLHIHGITQLKFLNDPVPCHGYPTLVHLRRLKLKNCRFIFATSFSLLLECCRLLEVFIFSRGESPDGSIIQELSWNNWNLDYEITPRQIVDQISIKVPKALKYLVIGLWFGWEGILKRFIFVKMWYLDPQSAWPPMRMETCY